MKCITMITFWRNARHFPALYNTSKCVFTGSQPNCISSSPKLGLFEISPGPIVYTPRRYYNRKKTVKVPPTKEFKLGFPGEIDSTIEPLNLSEPKLGFEGLPELEMSDETVKRIFSLDLADGNERKAKILDDVLDRIKEHPADVASLEVQIAALTVHIRHQVKHMLEFRKDKRSKIILFSRINYRRRKIEQLRQLDFEKFDWLLKELKIKYTPYHERLDKVGRKELRRRAAREKYEEVKQAKLEEFSKKLAEERKEFEKVKEKEFKEIQEQLKEFGINEEMTSLEETLELMGLGEPFVKPKEPTMSRRRQILAKKFELYKHRREESLK